MKRNLFEEISEGFLALQNEREEKITLRTHTVENKPQPEIAPEELLTLRKSFRMSRAVFAGYLHTNVRTLENWEQGRVKPNAQALVLIRLVKQYPDTVERLLTL